MTLESVHQLLRRSMKENAHSDKHITYVYHALCTKWQQIVIKHNDSLQHVDINDIFDTLRGISVLRLVGESKKLQGNDKNHMSVLEKLLDSMLLILKEILLPIIMKSNSYDLRCKMMDMIWTTSGTTKYKMSSHINKGIKLLILSTFHFSKADDTEYTTASFSIIDVSRR